MQFYFVQYYVYRLNRLSFYSKYLHVHDYHKFSWLRVVLAFVLNVLMNVFFVTVNTFKISDLK